MRRVAGRGGGRIFGGIRVTSLPHLRPRRRRLVPWLCAAAIAGGTAARAADLRLPPLAGELSGDFASALLPGAPALHWRLTLRGVETGAGRAAQFHVESEGLALRAEATLTALDTGSWHVAEGRVDLARWWPVVVEKLLPAASGITARGALAITGEGSLAAGRVAGRAQVALHDGEGRWPAHDLVLSGVTLTGGLRALPKLTSAEPFTLTVREATVAGLAARDLTIEFSIDDAERVQVRRATAQVFGGGVEVTPFEFPAREPAVKTDLHFNAIEIGQLARYLPPVLATASGKVSGRMSLAWSAAEGVVPGSGRLQIDPGGAAAIRLAPQPGFFTQRVPRRLAVLPESWGALSRWLSIDNPAYEPLRAIEMGETPLHIESLDVGLRPEGDPAGRTARIVLVARPEADKVIKSVRFEVNVAGPLADVLRLGITRGVRVNVH